MIASSKNQQSNSNSSERKTSWLDILGLAVGAVALGATAYGGYKYVEKKREERQREEMVNKLIDKAPDIIGAGVNAYAGNYFDALGNIGNLVDDDED